MQYIAFAIYRDKKRSALILAVLYLNDDGAINEDGVGHVEADGKNPLVQELQITTSRLDRYRGVPENKTS